MVGETPCKDPLRHKNRRPGLVASTQPRLEILIAEAADFLQFVAVAVPQPDRRPWDAVEPIGLDHRIMRLVEEGETLAAAGVAGKAIKPHDRAGERKSGGEGK